MTTNKTRKVCNDRCMPVCYNIFNKIKDDDVLEFFFFNVSLSRVIVTFIHGYRNDEGWERIAIATDQFEVVRRIQTTYDAMTKRKLEDKDIRYFFIIFLILQYVYVVICCWTAASKFEIVFT